MSRSSSLSVFDLPPAVYRDTFRIYYEDVDAGGIVYHANYLRYFERARTDWLRSLGIHQRALSAQRGIFFVVRDMSLDFRAPARLDDLLEVDVRVLVARRASLELAQVARLTPHAEVLVSTVLKIAAINPAGRPVALPSELLERLADTAP